MLPLECLLIGVPRLEYQRRVIFVGEFMQTWLSLDRNFRFLFSSCFMVLLLISGTQLILVQDADFKLDAKKGSQTFIIQQFFCILL